MTTISNPDLPLRCLLFEGLCNRLNGLASAMASGHQVLAHWAVNQHCPISFEEIFASGVDGIDAINEQVSHYDYQVSETTFCWFYPRNVANLPQETFRHGVLEGYRRLYCEMNTRPQISLDHRSLGIQFRRHLDGADDLDSYMSSIEGVIRQARPKQAYITSDCSICKESLTEKVASLGVEATSGKYPLLNHDLDRSKDNVLGMCRDLQALSACKLGVVCNSSRSTVPDSLKAFGVQAYFTYDDGYHRYGGRDDLFEMLPVERLYHDT